MLAQQDLEALRIKAEQMPESVERWLDLCTAAEQVGDYGYVLKCGDEMVRLAPDKPQPHFIRGLALQNLDHIEEAIKTYLQVLKIQPDYWDAWVNLGECYRFLNKILEAEQVSHQVIALCGQKINCSDDELGKHHWNLALLELLKGDYKQGFAHYPARFKAIEGRERPSYPQVLWRGEDLRGKTILITVDQGHGDTLLMARFLPLLREQGAKVIWQVQPPLYPYLKEWNGVDQILNGSSMPLPLFDYHASEFDVPRYLGISPDNLPNQIPILPVLLPDQATRLPGTEKLKVGVTWGGNPKHNNDQRRSVPLKELKDIFHLPGISFYALNRDMRAGDVELLTQWNVRDLSSNLNDFAASAHFINQFDLVISCDTAVAHLAGSMGKPLWVLLPFAPSWCWMLGREDSPWYPSARLFRQAIRGNWRGVVDRVIAELNVLKKQH